MPYFILVDSFDGAGCPVCALVAAAVDRWFENLLYESVNDRPLRARFDRDAGFCNRHAHRLGGSGDGLAAGILYREIFRKTVACLDRRSPGGDAPTACLPVHTGRCTACDYERDTERRMTALIADFSGDAEFRGRFHRSRGLCIPHLALVAARFPGGALPAWMADFHEGIYRRLLGELDGFLESFNCTRDANRDPERSAGVVTGERGSGPGTGEPEAAPGTQDSAELPRAPGSPPQRPGTVHAHVRREIPRRATGYAGMPRPAVSGPRSGLAKALLRRLDAGRSNQGEPEGSGERGGTP